jgi:phosphoglycerate dehydrogenase-like enzyme
LAPGRAAGTEGTNVPGYRGHGYQGKVAVVTGTASGIGYAVAARAAAEGMTVVLADIDTGTRLPAAG